MPAIPSRKPDNTQSSAKDGSHPLACRSDPQHAQPRSGRSPARQSSVTSLGLVSALDPNKSDLSSQPGDHASERSLLGSAPGSSAPSPTPGSPRHAATGAAAHAVLPPPAPHELQCARLVNALSPEAAAAAPPPHVHRRERASSATGGIAAAMARGPFLSARLSGGRPSRAKPKAGRVRQNTKDLIQRRRADSCGKGSAGVASPTPSRADSPAPPAPASPGPPAAPSPLAPPPAGRAPKLKPKKPAFPGSPATGLLSATLRRSASAAALRGEARTPVDLQSALAEGIVAAADVNVYGMRTPWAGLVSQQYARRNHRPFLELYELGRVIGTGGYAVVRECVHRATGERFAAKMMTVSEDPASGGRDIDKQALLNELEMMSALQHPNVVSFVEYFLQNDPAAPHCGACVIVMELLEGPDMMDYIDEAGGFTRDDAKTLLRELLDAVAHMHAHGISHRDLKLENLVFGRAGAISTVSIVDFGLAKAARARERMEGVTGTLWYTAPEVLKGVPYSPVVDLWSLGVVGYLVLTALCYDESRFATRGGGEYPFEVPLATLPEPEPGWEEDYDWSDSEDEPARLAQWRVNKREEALEDLICDAEPCWRHAAFDADPVARDLIQGLLDKDPRARLTAQEALEHCWFTGHGYNDAATLKHVHVRVAALASAFDLPARTFAPGELICTAGQRASRAAEAFLITRGEAEVLRPRGAAGDERLCARRAGNLVGALQLHVDDPDTLHHSPTPSVGSPGATPLARSPDAAEAWPGRGAAAAGAPRSASLRLRAAVMVVRAARRWVGHRRTVSVRAVTPVDTIVLSHEDLKWAVAHDYRMSDGFARALKQRKLAVVRAIRAERRAAKDAAGAGAAAEE